MVCKGMVHGAMVCEGCVWRDSLWRDCILRDSGWRGARCKGQLTGCIKLVLHQVILSLHDLCRNC